MAERDIQRIVPLLSTFCSMFSYSLLTLHDADFYGDNDGELKVLSCVSEVHNIVCNGLLKF